MPPRGFAPRAIFAVLVMLSSVSFGHGGLPSDEYDEGQCAFVGSNGRCTERGFLEFHHVVPYAAGGATTADNLQLRCRAHNAFENQEYFGSLWVRDEGVGFGAQFNRSGPDRVEN